MLVDCVAFDNWPVPFVPMARAVRGLIARLPPALIRPLFLVVLRNLGRDAPAQRSASASLPWKPYAHSVGPRVLANQLHHLTAHDTPVAWPTACTELDRKSVKRKGFACCEALIWQRSMS
uniref:hypothetical protein n=1 Tax=Azospirillum sp. SYSU D00513 TaxID=2812561 RepID=UPI001A9596C8